MALTLQIVGAIFALSTSLLKLPVTICVQLLTKTNCIAWIPFLEFQRSHEA